MAIMLRWRAAHLPCRDRNQTSEASLPHLGLGTKAFALQERYLRHGTRVRNVETHGQGDARGQAAVVLKSPHTLESEEGGHMCCCPLWKGCTRCFRGLVCPIGFLMEEGWEEGEWSERWEEWRVWVSGSSVLAPLVFSGSGLLLGKPTSIYFIQRFIR